MQLFSVQFHIKVNYNCPPNPRPTLIKSLIAGLPPLFNFKSNCLIIIQLLSRNVLATFLFLAPTGALGDRLSCVRVSVCPGLYA